MNKFENFKVLYLDQQIFKILKKKKTKLVFYLLKHCFNRKCQCFSIIILEGLTK